MLKCADDSLYTGISNDVDARVIQHNSGKGAKYTRSKLPVKLVFVERAENKGEALRREIQIKKLSSQQKRDLVADNHK